MESLNNPPDSFRNNTRPKVAVILNLANSRSHAVKQWELEKEFFHRSDIFCKPNIVDLSSEHKIIGMNASRVNTLLCHVIKNDWPDYLVVYGGDGTNHTVLQSLMHLEPKFIEKGQQLPALVLRGGGTGNDFLRNFQKIELSQLASHFFKKPICELDTGKLSYPEAPEKAVYFLNGANVGYAGWVTAYMAKPELMGRWQRNYALATLKAIAACRPRQYQVKFDAQLKSERTMTSKLANIAMMKGRYFGNGIRIAPSAQLNDGKIHSALIQLPLFHKLPWDLVRLFTGGIQKSNFIRYESCQSLDISWEGNAPLPIDIDGESYQASQLSVEILPKRVRILAEMKN